LPKVSLVIPAYNEEKTVGYVIKQAKLVKEISEIIVIDDGSKDKTAKIARELGVEVIHHYKNLGKGEAIKTGISYATGGIILFLDADLRNITAEKIRVLITPILKNKADFVKASFNLERGRVTEFAVKPMMKVLYPETSFKQPISGQFAGKKSFLKKIQIEPRWGIDIAILLDAIKQGQRVVEVNIGELLHKGRTTEEKAEMSKEVMETMLKKAGLLCSKHKLIIFSDKIVFSEGFVQQSKLILENLRKKKIKICLITAKDINLEYKKYFDIIKNMNPLDGSKDILNYARSVARRFSVGLDETVLVTNRVGFELLAKGVCLAFCFDKSPLLLKEKCKIIKSPSEVLIYLE